MLLPRGSIAKMGCDEEFGWFQYSPQLVEVITPDEIRHTLFRPTGEPFVVTKIMAEINQDPPVVRHSNGLVDIVCWWATVYGENGQKNTLPLNSIIF